MTIPLVVSEMTRADGHIDEMRYLPIVLSFMRFVQVTRDKNAQEMS
jgi:hypothetical protein